MLENNLQEKRFFFAFITPFKIKSSFADNFKVSLMYNFEGQGRRIRSSCWKLIVKKKAFSFF